ncbi:hypothetical protein APS_2614 [Acetobacter pasteurianus subsp. pasteurianus LMG 1262 = NBRC 106471]|nr:hypothetical protein APS_2614 [Acetobacter pasteurianus subsp. pasteurianus LMG 1262 = NBRC 106471]
MGGASAVRSAGSGATHRPRSGRAWRAPTTCATRSGLVYGIFDRIILRRKIFTP